MQIAYFIWDMLKLIPAFWQAIFNLLTRSQDVYGFEWQFMKDLDRFLSTNMPPWVEIAIVAGVYLVICVLMSFLTKKIVLKINGHLNRHGCSILYNWYFTLAFLVLMGLDAVVGTLGGQADASFDPNNIPFIDSAFGTIAIVVFIVGVIRMLIVFKWRALYFLPLQLVFLLWIYIDLLFWAPALLIAGVLIGAGSAASDKGAKYRCPVCGHTFTGIGDCPCGRSTSA